MTSADSSKIRMNYKQECKKTKQLLQECKGIISRVQENRVEFLFRELELGLTLVKLARDSADRGQAQSSKRQKANAREAHQTILRFLPDTAPGPDQKTKIKTGLAVLDSKLKALSA